MAKTTGQALSKRHCASPFSTTGKNNVAPGIIHGIPERLSEFRRYVRRGSPPRCAPQSPPLVGHGVLDDTLPQGGLLPCASLAHPLLTLAAACASFSSGARNTFHRRLPTPTDCGFSCVVPLARRNFPHALSGCGRNTRPACRKIARCSVAVSSTRSFSF